jgi:hypothetical protein
MPEQCQEHGHPTNNDGYDVLKWLHDTETSTFGAVLQKNNDLYVTFRGTIDYTNAKIDASTGQVPLDAAMTREWATNKKRKAFSGARIHQGFMHAYSRLRGDMLAVISSVLKEGSAVAPGSPDTSSSLKRAMSSFSTLTPVYASGKPTLSKAGKAKSVGIAASNNLAGGRADSSLFNPDAFLELFSNPFNDDSDESGAVELNGRRIFFCGHSLGGALATLAALDVLATLRLKCTDVVVYTLGSPRVGNHTFANAFNKSVPHCFRLQVDGDIVTGFPKTKLGLQTCCCCLPSGCATAVGLVRYKHVGVMVWLDGSGLSPLILDPLVVEQQYASFLPSAFLPSVRPPSFLPSFTFFLSSVLPFFVILH